VKVRTVGAVLLAGAILAPIVRFALVSSVEWTPLTVLLPPSGTVTGEFDVDRSGRYELAVRIDRPSQTSSTDAECRLGFDWIACESAPPMRLRWTLQSSDGLPVRCGDEARDAGIVDSRSSGGRFTPMLIERWVGCFDARIGVRYALDVVVTSNLDALRPFNPRVVVSSSSVLDRERHSLTAATWVISLLVAVAGLLLADRAPRPVSAEGVHGSHQV